MRSLKSLPFVRVFFVLVAVSSLFFQSCQKTEISLQEDLSIGVDEGDENLIFGSIQSICIDAEDNVYILDTRMWRIQKFDSRGAFIESFPVQEGQGPGEISTFGRWPSVHRGKFSSSTSWKGKSCS
jgi:hypothetical protein